MKGKTGKWVIARIEPYLKLKYIEDSKNLFGLFKKFINEIDDVFE